MLLSDCIRLKDYFYLNLSYGTVSFFTRQKALYDIAGDGI